MHLDQTLSTLWYAPIWLDVPFPISYQMTYEHFAFQGWFRVALGPLYIIWN
jgi:hypothetical protein